MWCIQSITPEYRERMYDVLDLYEEPYDPKRPVLGVDEKPKQLLEDSRPSIPMRPGHPTKRDYEYIRRGKANIFMCVEPKAGRRTTSVTEQRTKKDFALFVKHLVDDEYTEAERLHVVLDNLNTHNETSLLETFDEGEARRILAKVEFHYTPKHASWLNVAEIEIGVMDTECTRRRINSKDVLREEVVAWTERRNRKQAKIDWRFTRRKADTKLSKYYVS